MFTTAFDKFKTEVKVLFSIINIKDNNSVQNFLIYMK